MPIPLMFISDAPTAGTGLARITRDLATRIAQHMPDTFRVATFGYGGIASRHLPFQQYVTEDMQDWQLPTLPEVWHDFAGDEKGIVLGIWDSIRLLWFSRPECCAFPRLRQFVTNPPFEKWTYTPIDASGPNGKLAGAVGYALDGFDRVLSYSQWAEEIMRRSMTNPKLL